MYILANPNDEYVLMVREKILVRSSSLVTIVIAFIGMHYVSDMDYEEWCEPALTILQYIIFREEKAPIRSMKQIDKLWKEYCQFKHED